MESNDKDDVMTAAQQCGTQLNIPLDNVLKCAKTRIGNGLEHQMAVKTDMLQPTHTYVPWVTVNGNHTEQIQQQAQNDLIGLICNTFTVSKDT
jgi:interferon gamma-inducible protein 30